MKCKLDSLCYLLQIFLAHKTKVKVTLRQQLLACFHFLTMSRETNILVFSEKQDVLNPSLKNKDAKPHSFHLFE